MFRGYSGGSDSTPENLSYRYFDDMYIDTTFARVMLADSQDYESATIVEPQIPFAWSETSISCTVNLGRLDADTVYAFVFDADDRHNVVGFPVTVSDLSECSDGVDNDGDGYGVGPSCIAADCDDASDEIHPGAAERCNNTDDNCDGSTDESWSNLGEGCLAGRGACAVTGEIACRVDATGVECNAVAGTPAAQEICDGVVDDDCDGHVDNGCDCTDGSTRDCYAGPIETLNVGACRGGRQVCVDGSWGACAGQVLPEHRENCTDSIDNDCDGETDQSDTECACTTGSSRHCYSGPQGTVGVGECHEGLELCEDAVWGECVGQTLPYAELCDDRLDNDCDGMIDTEDEQDCGETDGPSTTVRGGCDCGSTPAPIWVGLWGMWLLSRAPRPLRQVAHRRRPDSPRERRRSSPRVGATSERDQEQA